MNNAITIKTLSEILADMGEPTPAPSATPNDNHRGCDDCHHSPKHANPPPKTRQNTHASPTKPHSSDLTPAPALPKQRTKTPSQKKSPPTPQMDKRSAVEALLHDDNQSVLDDNLLKLLSKVEIEKLVIPDKETRYLRWLAFYYLGRREHSQKELREKLLAKDCDPVAVDELLCEFAEKGYQSDERMTSALIKDGIGKQHGTMRILQTLKKHGLTTISSLKDIQTWIDEHDEFFGDLHDNDTTDGDLAVDWLAQAVSARCKKYGDSIPTDQKEKARQLRFLQYRGFDMDICFKALKMTSEDLGE